MGTTTINVGRSTSGGVCSGVFGNPYKIGEIVWVYGFGNIRSQRLMKNAGDTLPLYESYLRKLLNTDTIAQAYFDIEICREGAVLWCPGCGFDAPDCHARVIEKVAKERKAKSAMAIDWKKFAEDSNKPAFKLRVLRNDTCEDCTLGKQRTLRNRCVMGRGNPHAKVMLIGEAPGADEDAIGLPFVGCSGKLLNKAIRAAGLHVMQDVYITNIAKCRPPLNRAPTEEETVTCSHYLNREIELVQPRAFVLLGSSASNLFSMFDRSHSREKHKLLYDYTGASYMNTWHPEECLQSGGVYSKPFAQLVEDIGQAAASCLIPF